MADGQLTKQELFDRTDASLLAIEDLFQVLTEVNTLGQRACDLGIALGLSISDLPKGIELKEVLQLWLNQTYDVEKWGLPSYQTLVRAVDSRVGGQNTRLAKKIARDHQTLAMAVQDSNGSLSTPVCETGDKMEVDPPLVAQPPVFLQENCSKSLGGGQVVAMASLSSHATQAFSPCSQMPLSSDSHPVESDGRFSIFLSGKSQLPPCLTPYKMDKDPHGLILIINNIDFPTLKNREGAHLDGNMLSQTFTNLRYHLYRNCIHLNCNKAQMVELLQSVSQVDHTEYDSFVCCILSHGKHDVLYSADRLQLSMEEVQKPIIDCPSLVGKPKIFLFQSCRGLKFPESRPIQTDGDGDDSKIFLPHHSDVFVGFSTTPDTQSCRFTDVGSWYVIELCKALDMYHRDRDFVSMVTAAHYEVATNPEYVLEKPDLSGRMKRYKQSPQLVSSLIRPVYF